MYNNFLLTKVSTKLGPSHGPLAVNGCWQASHIAGWSSVALCTPTASWWPHLAPADGSFDGLGRTSCSRSILLWDSTFQFLRGDLVAFLPVATFHTHLAASCQVSCSAAHISCRTSSNLFSFSLECWRAPQTTPPTARPFVSALQLDFCLCTFTHLLSFHMKRFSLITHSSTLSFQHLDSNAQF